MKAKLQVLEKNFEGYPRELKDIIFNHDRNARTSDRENGKYLSDYDMSRNNQHLRDNILGIKIFPHICLYQNTVEFVDDMLTVCESMDIVGVYQSSWHSIRHIDSSSDITELDLKNISSRLTGKSFVISIKFTYKGKIYPVSCFYSRFVSRYPGTWPSELAWSSWIADELTRFGESSSTMELMESRLRKEFINSCRIKTGKVLIEFGG